MSRHTNPSSGRNPYGDYGGSSNGNDNHQNGNPNDANNNYHLRNPYTQSAEANQHRQQQQQLQNQNHPGSHMPRNPYARTTQQYQQQQKPVEQSQYGSSITNSYGIKRQPRIGSDITASSSSFAINPVPPQHRQPQPPPQPQLQRQPQQYREHEPIHNADRSATLSSSFSSSQVHAPSAPIQQEANHNSTITHHEQNDTIHTPTNSAALHQHSEREQLLEKLRSELDQSTESNFELEASVVALEAELKHTRKTLTDQAQQEKSKLEHELRLAQQEAKRWKILAQQQQQQSNQGRSIVSDAGVGGDAFSSRLFGNPANLHPSKPAREAFPAESSHGIDYDASSSSQKKPKNDSTTGTGNDCAGRNDIGENDSPRSTPGRKVPQNPPIVRLALNLLAQLEPAVSMTKFKNKAKEKTPTHHNNAMTTGREDHENGNQDGDDSVIRQVLLSIATPPSVSVQQFRATVSANNNNHDSSSSSSFPSAYRWTEGDLLEWLVRKSSFESADRYWSTLLLQSPEARNHVVERVARSEKGSNSADIFHPQEKQQQTDSSTTINRRSRRKDRIRFACDKNETIGQDQRLKQIRAALRNPLWDPNENQAGINETTKQNAKVYSISSAACSSSLLRNWVQWLASSQDPVHLQTLRILLAEAAGRNRMAATAVANGNADESNTTNSGAESWWNLCYPPIATTIQRIAYRKLIRSRKKNSNEFHGNRRKKNAVTKRNDTDFRRRPRRRIGKFEDRLAQLPSLGVIVAPSEKENKETTNTEIDSDKLVEPDATDPKRKSISSKLEGEDRRFCLEGNVNGTDNFVSQAVEDRVFELTLTVWLGLLEVASPRQLCAWYKNRSGLGTDQSWKKNKTHYVTSKSPPPSNGLFMMSLLLDLFEELQFGQWMRDEEASGNTSMSFSQILSNGVNSDVIHCTGDLNAIGGNKKSAYLSHSRKIERDSSNKYSGDGSSSPSAIPQWYNAAIAVLTQVGRTEKGMEILRTRLPDSRKSDWMGNALDVSIRQLHTLVLNLNYVRTRHGSIVRLGECTCTRDEDYDTDDIINDDPHAARLCRGVEAWVRLWHQVLLFVQSKETISFRSLVLDQRDWFTSSCATLLTSEEIRPEIKSMIRWQLDELVMDEEDYEESKHQP